jgi:hypothetical protein
MKNSQKQYLEVPLTKENQKEANHLLNMTKNGLIDLNRLQGFLSRLATAEDKPPLKSLEALRRQELIRIGLEALDNPRRKRRTN